MEITPRDSQNQAVLPDREELPMRLGHQLAPLPGKRYGMAVVQVTAGGEQLWPTGHRAELPGVTFAMHEPLPRNIDGRGLTLWSSPVDVSQGNYIGLGVPVIDEGLLEAALKSSGLRFVEIDKPPFLITDPLYECRYLTRAAMQRDIMGYLPTRK